MEELGDSHWIFNGNVSSQGWSYYHIDVKLSDISKPLKVTLQRTSKIGDPDIYIQLGSYPSITNTSYLSAVCEPCGAKSIIVMESVSVGRYIIGIFGYCCDDSTYVLEVEPYSPAVTPLSRIIAVVGGVIGGIILLVMGIFLYKRYKYRQQENGGLRGNGHRLNGSLPTPQVSIPFAPLDSHIQRDAVPPRVTPHSETETDETEIDETDGHAPSHIVSTSES